MSEREAFKEEACEECGATYHHTAATCISNLKARLENSHSQRQAAIACEKADCEKVLLALAGWYPIPQEGYGYNTSWAISDLCKAAESLKLERDALRKFVQSVAEATIMEGYDTGSVISDVYKNEATGLLANRI